MFNLLEALASVKPSDVYPYIDLVILWLARRLSKREAWELQYALRANCGGDGEDNYAYVNAFDHARAIGTARYFHEVKLYQPHYEALALLADYEHRLIEAQIALDWTLANWQECLWMEAAMHEYLVQGWHNTKEVRFCIGTRYGADEDARNQPVFYTHKPSKRTGEWPCGHFEWRIVGADAMGRTHGLWMVEDLMELEFRAFFTPKLKLGWIDFVRLGRKNQNMVDKTPWRRTQDEDHDRLMGGILAFWCARGQDDLRAGTRPAQHIVDRLGRVGRECLVPIDMERFLPAPSRISDQGGFCRRGKEFHEKRAFVYI